jgi:hypothetical protein
MTELTILEEHRATVVDASVDGGVVRVPAHALERALGWELQPEGFCAGSVCYPLPEGSGIVSDAGVDLAAFAALIARPAAVDAAEGAAFLGTPAQERALALGSLNAPAFTLPDLDGRAHSLADWRGRKVLLAAWASW